MPAMRNVIRTVNSQCHHTSNFGTDEYWFCGNCFPASAKVSLKNGKSVTMSKLQKGDAVKSGKLTIIQKGFSRPIKGPQFKLLTEKVPQCVI